MPETKPGELSTRVTTTITYTEGDGNVHTNNEPLLETNLEEEEENFTAEDLAPEGGWGWMVALAMIVVIITALCATPSFSLVFGEFFAATGQPGSTLTLLNSVFMISFSFSGLLTTALLKNYPMRPVGVIGAVLFAVPNIMTALVYHVWQMALIFFVQGIGLGIMNTIWNANFNAYWVKKRSKVMSAAQIIIGLGGIVYPLLIEKMMNVYGSRGTAAMIGVLSLHCIVGMMMMHPVEWHSKDPDEVRKERLRLAEERRKLMSERLHDKPVRVGGSIIVHPVLANRRSTIHGAQVFAEPSRWSSLTSLKEAGGGRGVPLLIESFKARVDPDVDNGIRMRSRSGTNRASMIKRMSGFSATSLGHIPNVGTFVELPRRIEKKGRKVDKIKVFEEKQKGEEKNQEDEESKPLGIWSTVNELFELSHLENRAFMLTALGISFVFTSDTTFASLFPLMMTHRGYETSDTALILTVSAATELMSRIFLAAFTFFFDVQPKILFFVAMISIGFAKIGFLYFEHTLTGVLITSAFIGAIRSWIYVPHSLVLVDNFPIENHAAVYGIFSLVNGMTMIVFGPVVGFIKDWTDSYTICQMVLIVLNSIFIIPWSMELLGSFQKNRRKVKESKQNLDFQSKIDPPV